MRLMISPIQDIWAAAQATNAQTFDLTQIRTAHVEGIESKSALDAIDITTTDQQATISHKHSNTQP